MKNITITKVVSKNFFLDFYSTIQNTLGRNLTQYEKMVQKGLQQIQEELATKKIVLKWYRYEITQLNNNAVSITLYGDAK